MIILAYNFSKYNRPAAQSSVPLFKLVWFYYKLILISLATVSRCAAVTVVVLVIVLALVVVVFHHWKRRLDAQYTL